MDLVYSHRNAAIPPPSVFPVDIPRQTPAPGQDMRDSDPPVHPDIVTYSTIVKAGERSQAALVFVKCLEWTYETPASNYRSTRRQNELTMMWVRYLGVPRFTC